MSAYIPVELKRKVRDRFQNCCAYCRTAELLSAAIFEFEHIIPLSAGGETVFKNLFSFFGYLG
ncbi:MULTISPECIES: HNH endonuclease signature motif containing protein [Spirulina sp. CCY15215]|uniref:HNH endonuclease n=1 Tax=Spirulina sp. CCY15215 TaxID=2767591 RepID=UPI00194EA240|nr:HNH endonuclease signature motif containing protein [Spirulina major]